MLKACISLWACTDIKPGNNKICINSRTHTRVQYKLEAEANFNGVSLDYFHSARFQKQTHRVMKRQIRRLLIEDVWIARNAIIGICHFKWTVHQFMIMCSWLEGKLQHLSNEGTVTQCSSLPRWWFWTPVLAFSMNLFLFFCLFMDFEWNIEYQQTFALLFKSILQAVGPSMNE